MRGVDHNRLGMGEEMDRRGAVAATGGVLEANAEWSAGVAGSADGSGASGTAGLCGSVCGIGTGREADCGAERAESTAWGDAVHDVAGGGGGGGGGRSGGGGGGGGVVVGQSVGGRRDVVIGTPVAGRGRVEIENLIG